jgi:hypothetical protein
MNEESWKISCSDCVVMCEFESSYPSITGNDAKKPTNSYNATRRQTVIIYRIYYDTMRY